jgi:hypothetical protein
MAADSSKEPLQDKTVVELNDNNEQISLEDADKISGGGTYSIPS